MLTWDREVIVLIHGGPGGNHTLYSDIEESLLEIADLVLLDLRGCGLSEKIDTQFCTLNVHIDDLKFILQALSLKKPIVHGCSYGAIVTLGFGIKYPELPKKLILTSCAASGEFISQAKENLRKIGTDQQIAIAEQLWEGTFKNPQQFTNYYLLMAPLYFFKKEDLNIPATPTHNIPYNIELINFAFTTFLKKFDFRDELFRIKAKTLIFSGKNDWIFVPNQAHILYSGIKSSILVNIDDCGHFPWKDQRDIFLSHVRSFIKSNDKSTP